MSIPWFSFATISDASVNSEGTDMTKGERTKKLSFRLWAESKSLAEIQTMICGESETPPSSVKEWIVEWERGRQRKWEPEVST